MSKCLLIAATLMYWICFVNTECGDNEMFVECAHCGPKTCEQLGYPIPCGSACRSQCACFDGYVRSAEGKCILKEECPACGGDKNATSGCGNYCGRRCSDYSEDDKICFTGCRYNSCDCRPGYILHDELKICILPNDCFDHVFYFILRNNFKKYFNFGWTLIDGKYEYYWFDGPQSPTFEELSSDLQELEITSEESEIDEDYSKDSEDLSDESDED